MAFVDKVYWLHKVNVIFVIIVIVIIMNSFNSICYCHYFNYKYNYKDITQVIMHPVTK